MDVYLHEGESRSVLVSNQDISIRPGPARRQGALGGKEGLQGTYIATNKIMGVIAWNRSRRRMLRRLAISSIAILRS